ncbi:hypothetical protein CUJ87_30515 [Paraburkholderia caledonica]|nr:hypothetical protein CUJ87_30515 [Paraburkholderia caledonica]
MMQREVRELLPGRGVSYGIPVSLSGNVVDPGNLYSRCSQRDQFVRVVAKNFGEFRGVFGPHPGEQLSERSAVLGELYDSVRQSDMNDMSIREIGTWHTMELSVEIFGSERVMPTLADCYGSNDLQPFVSVKRGAMKRNNVRWPVQPVDQSLMSIDSVQGTQNRRMRPGSGSGSGSGIGIR